MIGSGYGFIDDVVEEAHGQAHHALHLVPVHRPFAILAAAGELRDVERAEVARLVRQERLLAARIGRLDLAQRRRRVGRARVDAIDEDHARIARAPRGAHDALEHLARGQAADHLLGVRVDEVVLLAVDQGLHERVGHGHGDVEVRDPAIELAVDELEDVGMIDLQDPHVRAAPRPALLHRLRRAIEHAQEGHRPGGAPAGGGHDVVLGAQPREREPRPATGLVDDGRGLDGVEDLLHRVANGQDVARGVLQAVALARIHQRRRVGDELALDHHVVEGLGHLPHRGRAAPVPGFTRRNGHRDPPAHFLRRLDHFSVLAEEIALAEDAKGGFSPLADSGGAGLRQHPAPPISCGARDSSTQYLAFVKKKAVHRPSTARPPAVHRACTKAQAPRFRGERGRVVFFA
jgi:hypothetical protein